MVKEVSSADIIEMGSESYPSETKSEEGWKVKTTYVQ